MSEKRRAQPGGSEEEAGKVFIVMLLVVLPTLILLLGISFDLGNLATGVEIAQMAADVAALEAGKLVDAAYQETYGEIRLRQLAPAVAQQVADEITEGAFRVTDVYVSGRFVVVEGEVAVRTPFLEMFIGRHSVTRPVQGIAEAMYGSVTGEGE